MQRYGFSRSLHLVLRAKICFPPKFLMENRLELPNRNFHQKNKQKVGSESHIGNKACRRVQIRDSDAWIHKALSFSMQRRNGRKRKPPIRSKSLRQVAYRTSTDAKSNQRRWHIVAPWGIYHGLARHLSMQTGPLQEHPLCLPHPFDGRKSPDRSPEHDSRRELFFQKSNDISGPPCQPRQLTTTHRACKQNKPPVQPSGFRPPPTACLQALITNLEYICLAVLSIMNIR